MAEHHAILDTNVLVAGIRSRTGASAELLRLLLRGTYRIAISATLVFEYEEILQREAVPTYISEADAVTLIGTICEIGIQHDTRRRESPLSADIDDEFILDLVQVARVNYLVTHNLRHFSKVKLPGLKVVTPQEFLKMLRTP